MNSKSMAWLAVALFATAHAAQGAINFSTDTANDLVGTFSVTGTGGISLSPTNFDFGLSYCQPVRATRSTNASVGLQCAGTPNNPGATLQNVASGAKSGADIGGMTTALAGTTVPTFYFAFTDLQDTGGAGGSFTGSFCFSRSSTGCQWTAPTASITGFYAPVEAPSVATNLAKAGRTIPLRFYAQTTSGPIADLTSVKVTITGVTCESLSTALDPLEEYVPGRAVGLQNLGGGNYQYNWNTSIADQNTCKTVTLSLPDAYTTATSPIAHFRFGHK